MQEQSNIFSYVVMKLGYKAKKQMKLLHFLISAFSRNNTTQIFFTCLLLYHDTFSILYQLEFFCLTFFFFQICTFYSFGRLCRSNKNDHFRSNFKLTIGCSAKHHKNVSLFTGFEEGLPNMFQTLEIIINIFFTKKYTISYFRLNL